METILLIDGKNTAYRAVFAARGGAEFYRTHPFVVWLRFANMWINKFKPTTIHVFWDCPKNEVWRKKIYDDYKNNRDSMVHYAEDIQVDIRKTVDAACNILTNMNIRQYIRDHQESDDLIYSACGLLVPNKSEDRKVIIISSDSDFSQIQWTMPHVSVFEPRKGEFIKHPSSNPAIIKALCGDKADNIDGYRGIGPVKSQQLASDKKKLVEFLDVVGDHKFKRNLALIDLSLNPYRMLNELYVMRIMASDVNFNKEIINNLIMEHKVRGLISEYSKLVLSFKNLK